MKTILLATLLATGAAVTAWAQAPAADPVVMTVGNDKVTKSMFEAIVSTLTEQQQAAVATPESKRNLAMQIGELKMMAQEGRIRRLDQNATMQMKIVLQAETLLAQAVYAEMMKDPIPDAAVEAYYKEHESEWMEAKGKHILLRFEGSRVPPRDEIGRAHV